MKKALILYDRIVEDGGDPDQRDVLLQAEAVAKVLTEMGWEPIHGFFSLDLSVFMETLKASPPDFVFNLVESVEGHGRLIHFAPTLLDIAGTPYTGSGADSLYLTSHKEMAKKWLRSAGIPTPGSYSRADLEKGKDFRPGRYIIKYVWEHASIGLGEDSVIMVEDPASLLTELEKRCAHAGREAFAELYIEGREFNLSLLASPEGPEGLPPAEMRFENYPPGKLKMVDYKAKWEEDSFEYQHTRRSFRFPRSDETLIQRLKDLARRCWSLCDLRGYARVDFRVDEENHPWVLEINANPCLAPDAGFIAAATQAGLTYRQVVKRILQDSGIQTD
jgi:D-alanine-D-alanine ligase